ncbi:MAG: YihY/virulence factor BrkB family protein [Pedococcus sp.]
MSVKARVRRELLRVPGAMPVARMTVETIRVCLKYRVTGLASEAGFFMLLSLPPLVLGLFGGVGYLGKWLGDSTVQDIIAGIQEWAARFLTADLINGTLLPTVQDVFTGGRFDLISVGFLLSVWSGSRALNVFVDTISIMYGQSGVRGIVRTRALSLTLYLLSLVVGIVVIPLVVIGPTWLKDLLPKEAELLVWLYWPVVTVLAVASIATLFHISTPRRTPWARDVPGAVLTLVLWSLSSYVLRGTIAASLGGTSIYGPLSAPIALLIFLYALAIAVLIGAALNAAIRTLWPVEERPSLRAQTVTLVKERLAARKADKGLSAGSGTDAGLKSGAQAGGAGLPSTAGVTADAGAARGATGGATGGVAGLVVAQEANLREGVARGASGVRHTGEGTERLTAAEQELMGSFEELKEEALKPLTPVPDHSDDTQFGEEAPDPISFHRTRSG